MARVLTLELQLGVFSRKLSHAILIWLYRVLYLEVFSRLTCTEALVPTLGLGSGYSLG